MSVRAFPKIFTIGQDYIADIFAEDVEVTEKVDGSQFVFGTIGGVFEMRSKGKLQYPGAVDKLFLPATDHAQALYADNELPDDTVFYCETLSKPRHNVLAYEHVPRNHLVLFGVSTASLSFVSDHETLASWAVGLEIDVAPMLYRGRIETVEQLMTLLEIDSFLGGTKIEGVVAKNYARPFLLGGQPIPLMAGKFVSERFKETHRSNWNKENTSRGKWEDFLESFRTEARWQKSVAHLRESGELENSPRDIGKLIKAIQADIAEEETEDIKNFLWRTFGQDVIRKSTAGFPEWYKEQLLKSAFPSEEK